MPFVVCEPCINCKFTDCVDVCPVDCFREGENFLVIDPEECIDCGACVPACPVEAIFPEDEVPEEWSEYTELNARLCSDWPMIDAQQEPMDCSSEYQSVAKKRDLLSEQPAS
ncbi:MAG: ferredoxin FdxA [Myxococcota bacterium]|nr:ferredoxin FdxA [Myxococcota bacterium]